MDLQELLNTLANQVAFWQGKNDRYNVPVVNEARDIIKTTGKIADDYIGGGLGQAALRGPDALSRQIALNAALLALGEGASYGIGKAATKLGPKIAPELAALRNYLRNQQVVLHGSPLPVEGNQLIPVAGSQAAQDIPAVFSLHPEYPNALSDIADYSTIPFSQRGYVPKNSAGKTVPMDEKLFRSAKGNVIIGRTPKSNLLDFITGEPTTGVGIYKSTQPIDIVERVSAKQDYTKYVEDALQALKRQGVGTKTEKLLARIPKKK